MASIFKLIFGIIGNITALCLFTAPVPTFWRILKMKRVEDFSGVPYVTALFNCMLWTLYGTPVIKYQVLVITVNAAGVGFELIYLMIYLLYSATKPRMRVAKLLLVVVGVSALVGGMIIGLEQDRDRRRLILGFFSTSTCIAMYMAPLTITRLVIKTKSVEYMPFLLSLFVFLNGSAWFLYAIVPTMDIFIIVANALGILLGGMQLILYAMYRKTTPSKRHAAPDWKLMDSNAFTKVVKSGPVIDTKVAPIENLAKGANLVAKDVENGFAMNSIQNEKLVAATRDFVAETNLEAKEKELPPTPVRMLTGPDRV